MHREIRVRIVIRFLSLLIAVAAAVVPGARAGGMEAAIPLPPPGDRSVARAIFKELIEINTTHAHGSTEAAKAIASRLLAAGFAADDVHVLAPPDHPSKSSVVLRYHGKSAGRAVLFLGHLDVVDARPEDWSVDPFRLTEKDGWFYGRGTIDMKNGGRSAAFCGVDPPQARPFRPPARDVIVAFTADEEAGGDSNGPAFLLKNHRELIEAETAINLDGGQGNYKNGKPFYYEFGTSEKTYVTFTLEATSPGGHGSLPGPDNAIYRLAAGLGRLSAYKFPVMLTATTRTSFKMMADIDPGPDSADMRAVAKQPPDLAAAERLSQNVRFNAELRTTCVATLIAGGHAENALPQRARATVQCRMMPGDSAAHVQSTLVSVLNDGKIGVTMDATPIESPESPPTEAITRKISPTWCIRCGRAYPSSQPWPGI